jgi:hypothetical protein
VNGGRDPLYPTARVDPYMDHFKRNGVVVEYHPQPNAGHNTAWWPQVKDQFEAFARDHARKPLPDTLTWETSDVKAHNRAHWLVVDALGKARDEAQSLPDLNEMVDPGAGLGVAVARAHHRVDARVERRSDRCEGGRQAESA